MADKEMIQEKIGEALGLEKAAQKAVEQLDSRGLLINFEVVGVSMGSKRYFIFAVAMAFVLIYTPNISSAQWPITEQPSLGQQGLNEKYGFALNSNQSLPSGITNSTFSNSTP
jgi:hypothetical protein